MPAKVTLPALVLLAFTLGVWCGRTLWSDSDAKPSPDAAGARESPPARSGAAGGARQSADSLAPRVGSRFDLASLPPAGVVAALDDIDDAADRKAAIEACLDGMPVEQWGDWMEGVFAVMEGGVSKADISGMARYYRALNEVFDCVVNLDPVGFMAAQNSAGEPNDDGESMARVLVMLQWDVQDPEAAKKFLTSQLSLHDPAAGFSDAAELIAARMARQGDAGVFDWTATLPPDDHRKAAYAALGEMASVSPQRAAAELNRVRENLGEFPEGIARKITQSWAKEDPQAALAWAAVQSDDIRNASIQGVLESWAEADFDAALETAAALPSEITSAGLTAVLKKAPPARMGEVASLVESRLDGTVRAEASAEVMGAWTQHSPEEASNWMARQPAGEIRDRAISTFIRWADVRDPEAALLWAETISDPAARMDGIGHIITQLQADAPLKVLPWLASSTALTDVERDQILAQLPAEPR